MSRAALVTSAPFHLEATVRVLQRRPGNLVDVWAAGRYLRVLPADGKRVLVIASTELTEDGLATMRTHDAIRVLADLPGIGPWSAGLILLRGLGRLDVFPSGDVGAARGLRALLQVNADAQLRQIIERLGDRRGYLYFCALGGNLLGRGLIHPAPTSLPDEVK